LIQGGLVVQAVRQAGHIRPGLGHPRLLDGLVGLRADLRRVQAGDDLPRAHRVAGIDGQREQRAGDARADVLLVERDDRARIGHGVLERAEPDWSQGHGGRARGRAHGGHVHRLGREDVELSGAVEMAHGPARAKGDGDHRREAEAVLRESVVHRGA